MSRRVDSYEYRQVEYDFGDIVEFDGPYGDRMTGEIVRVYNAREDYHALGSDGERYSINIYTDNVTLVRRAS